MRVPLSAASVALAVPLIGLLLSPVPSGPGAAKSAVLADTPLGGGFSVLQKRARSVAARTSHGGGLTEEELVSLRANLTEEWWPFQRPSDDCVDKSPDCAQLAARWASCMDYDLTQQPPPTPRPLEPVEFMRQNCRKTCAYCGNTVALQEYHLRQIKNDEVDKELSYAKTGSVVPEGLHGIFWLDQWSAYPEGTKCDPSFQYNFESQRVNEMLTTFGDGLEWDPATRCVAMTPYSGRQGHWTYTNQGADNYGNLVWAMFNYPYRLSGDFCFKSDAFDVLEIKLRLVPALFVLQPIFRLLLGSPDSQGFFHVPSSLINFQMKKSCFGWHRVTTVGPQWFARLANTETNYAAFQIVDGNGKRTEHWPAYLRWANSRGTNCSEVLDGPCNLGDGTQLTPAWVLPNAELTSESPFYDAVRWLKKYSR